MYLLMPITLMTLGILSQWNENEKTSTIIKAANQLTISINAFMLGLMLRPILV
jgi:ABC-type dipeptide/oligopeptide/nickel transport system permease component